MKIHHLFVAMLCAALPILQGCSSEDHGLDTPDNEADGLYATLRVAVKGPETIAQSRAWPEVEPAVNNEGKLYDAFVIIYDKSLNASDLSAADKVIQCRKVDLVGPKTNSNNVTYYEVPKFKLSTAVAEGQHYVAIFANINDANVTAATFQDMELTTFRDLAYTGGLSTGTNNVGDVSGFNRFVMTSDAERTFQVTDSDISTHATVEMAPVSDPIVVKRLASRIDISFGHPRQAGETATGTLFYNASDQIVTWSNDGTPSAPIAYVEIPVYDYDAYKANPSELVTTYDKFRITGVSVKNIATGAERYIHKFKVSDNNQYLTNVTYTHRTQTQTNAAGQTENCYGTYANSYSQRPENGISIDADGETHSLANLIVKGNNLYTYVPDNNSITETLPYYTLGYYRENAFQAGSTTYAAATDNRTKVCLTGTYYKARTLSTGEVTYSTEDAINHLDLEFVIMHCKPDAGCVPEYKASMAYAISRNTIYRLRLDRIFTSRDRVYVIWYYDSTNDGTYDPYVTTTPFGSHIVDNNTTPND